MKSIRKLNRELKNLKNIFGDKVSLGTHVVLSETNFTYGHRPSNVIWNTNFTPTAINSLLVCIYSIRTENDLNECSFTLTTGFGDLIIKDYKETKQFIRAISGIRL